MVEMQAWATVGNTLVVLIVGLAQCALIWIGLRQMRAASASRDRQIDNQHQEVMTVLTAQSDTLAALVNGLASATRSLEAVIERTSSTAFR